MGKWVNDLKERRKNNRARNFIYKKFLLYYDKINSAFQIFIIKKVEKICFLFKKNEKIKLTGFNRLPFST